MRCQTPPVRLREVRISEPMLDIRYPQVVGLANNWVEGRINRTITRLVYSMIDEQRQGWAEGIEPAITGTYKVELNQSGSLSIVFENYGFPEHAAHGLTLQHSLTFDVATGYVYHLADLFRPGADYVDRLSEIVEQQIEERDIPLLKPFEGISPDQEFYLTPTSLVLYYPAYEITPGAAGIPTFPIPYSEIMDIVCLRGPIGCLVV